MDNGSADLKIFWTIALIAALLVIPYAIPVLLIAIWLCRDPKPEYTQAEIDEYRANINRYYR